MVIPALRTGCLAYYESFSSGLVPVKITKISKTEIQARVTAARPAYPKNFLIHMTNYGPVTSGVVPRDAVKNFRGKGRRILPFTIEVDRG